MRRYFGWALASIALLGYGGIESARAADMAPRTYTKAPPAPVAVYNWTGCYVGVEGGGDWGRVRSTSNGSINGVANFNFGVRLLRRGWGVSCVRPGPTTTATARARQRRSPRTAPSA